jgi:YD repeat-containing protein
MADSLIVGNLYFPENPRWHDNRLWFVDFLQGSIFAVDADGSRLEMVLELETDTPSGLGFLPDGSLLFVSAADKKILRFVDGAISLHADLSAYPCDFLNDMFVDDHGRAYVGSRFHRMANPTVDAIDPMTPPESVILVHADGAHEVAASNLVGPNGTAIANDGSLIVAETHAHRLTAFDRDAEGRLVSRRVYADVSDAFPDGICIDFKDHVWIASPFTNDFRRISPGGAMADRIVLDPVDGMPVACELGGNDNNSLFMLIAQPIDAGLPAGLGWPAPRPYPSSRAERMRARRELRDECKAIGRIVVRNLDIGAAPQSEPKTGADSISRDDGLAGVPARSY